MNDDWFILIYKVDDAEAQDVLAEGLCSLESLTIQAEHNNGDHFVVVECPGSITALAVHELVMSIDSDADLIDTHSSLPGIAFDPMVLRPV